ncbi:GntR family transcriptional regulator [Paracoccus aerius]|uniref:GntR family transcriptional regulator n=1 Tax=Paracoccus aerius TaxID=1915382 RepID=A0ABS1S703_9RHOB|nr:GntR family transcriptional regulator [Paracoccus aerius]MBL3674020.1 GntR family transcriptional regulator [Paracoccus aerius]GHG23715.1 transcriptional regulator [Paracoccus aerius]
MAISLAASFGLSAMQVQAGGGTVQRVYESLRKRIITLELPPDTTLSRTDLTETYGVSQTPIREALQLLKQEGLVHIFPQSKTVVTRIDVPQTYEAHFLRVALETEVCRRLATEAPADVLTRARSIIRMQEAIAEDTSQIAVFQELDELFHQTLFAGLRQSGLHQLVRERSGHLERIRRLHLPEQGKVLNILSGHRSIVDGIASGDPDAAIAAIRGHLSQTVSRVEALREEFPQYFA